MQLTVFLDKIFPMTFPGLLVNSQTAAKFPDISRFSRQVVFLLLNPQTPDKSQATKDQLSRTGTSFHFLGRCCATMATNDAGLHSAAQEATNYLWFANKLFCRRQAENK